jgi:hypothetical protein
MAIREIPPDVHNSGKIIDWLLAGDPAIRWQTLRDLSGADRSTVESERNRIAVEGWGARLLALQQPDGMWAGGLYSPKWISTTYTMLLLRRCGLSPDNEQAQVSCRLLLDRGFYRDGGINYFRSYEYSETCVTGMILSILAHFRLDDQRVERLVLYLLEQQMPDGGWNCESYKGATHSSLHTTVSVLEGLWEYERLNSADEGRQSIVPEVREAQASGREFLLQHRLFRSHRTGEIIDPRMTRLSFPPRWRYDALRALDYFRQCGAETDERLADAVEIVLKKRRPDGTWPLQSRHPGRSYFEMETVGQPSRWNTLRALRVLRWYRGSR